MICCIYFIVAEFGPANLYNYWAVLSLDIFLIVMWLASFALMASEVAPYMKAYSSYYSYDSSYYYSSVYSTDYSALGIFLACMAAVAGVGGLELYVFFSSPAHLKPPLEDRGKWHSPLFRSQLTWDALNSAFSSSFRSPSPR